MAGRGDLGGAQAVNELSADAAANRAFWDGWSDEYQRLHAETLRGAAWGIWQIPEAELHVLGDVAGKDVLELGCGAARFSIALARLGARCVGLDNSERQLEHARLEGADFQLVHAPADDVPLPDASFDIVFSDHGAFSWGDPYRVTPEAARLLRPGGLLAFNVSSPFDVLCWDDVADAPSNRLQRSYFDTARLEEEEGGVTFNLGYGDWVRLLRANDLIVVDLVEPRPPADAATTYGRDPDWARRWSGECIWVAGRL
jgi:SAM-dependent methyltransferase